MSMFEFFFGGTSGTNVSQANSGYTLLNPNNTAGFAYTNAVVNPLTSGTSARINAAAGTAAEARVAHPDANSMATQITFRVPPAPTAASCDILQLRGTVQNSGMRYHTNGSLRVLNLGTEVSGASYNDFATLVGQDVVVDLLTEEGTTSTNGRIRARVRLLSNLSTAVWEYDSGATRNAGVIGTDVINSSRAWKISGGAAFASDWVVFGHRSLEGATAYLADPTSSVTAPTAVVSVGTTAYYRFDATGSDPGTSPSLSYEATHISGSVGTPIESPEGVFYLPQGTGSSVYRITATGSSGADSEDVTVPAPNSGPTAGIRRRRWNGTSLVG